MIQWGSRVTAVLLAVGIAGATPVAGQSAAAGTAASVKELSTLLAEAGAAGAPRFIAAEVPGDASRFVAAMLLPDLQLVLVAADYRAPVLLRERVLTRKYREAYQDLQAASAPEGRIIVEDLLANGLAVKPAKGQTADAATIDGRTYTFDGQWRRAKLKEEEYTAAFSKVEAEYAKLLGLLVAQAKVK